MRNHQSQRSHSSRFVPAIRIRLGSVNRGFMMPVILVICLGLAGCGSSGPSQSTAKNTIADYLKSQENLQNPQIIIIQIGDRGQGDFAAPGSHDDYWPVKFTYSGIIPSPGALWPGLPDVPARNVGPTTVTAQIWKDKMGDWHLASAQEVQSN
jgi:hypothetical protein